MLRSNQLSYITAICIIDKVRLFACFLGGLTPVAVKQSVEQLRRSNKKACMSRKTGNDLFIVDNRDDDWKVVSYLAEWREISSRAPVRAIGRPHADSLAVKIREGDCALCSARPVSTVSLIKKEKYDNQTPFCR